ncbi:MAG: hypothetical protein ABI462_02860 [Ignavibacteria bacterium]
MSKRTLLVMSFLFVFTFTGVIDYFPTVIAKTESTSEQTDKRKKNKKGTSGKKSSKKTTGKKKSSGKKRVSGKKKSSGKKKTTSKKSKTGNKKGKRYSGKKKSKRNNTRKSSNNSNTSYRSSNTGTYTPPKTYDKSDNGSDREYKRSESSEPKETFKKEPKKDGE